MWPRIVATIEGMKVIRLKEGKERSLQRRHPWIFDSAIAKGGGDPGETVRVESHDGQFLAWAAFSPASKIRARAWSTRAEQRIDAAFFADTIRRAIAARARFPIASDSLRLVHGESDGLPGLIVDRYGDTLVAQFLSAGVERWKAVIADALLAETGLQRLYERSDASARQLEGLEPATGWLRGEGATELTITEHDWRLTLDIATGHKTGFYLDQRDSRHKFSQYARRLGFQRVLNCYCYTGGFSVAALAGGAAHAERAARAYKDINRLAFKLLEPGGVLFTYSCSGGISADLFHKIVASAGADAGVDGYITERLGGAPDHPMTLVFPEGEYLKGLVIQVKG